VFVKKTKTNLNYSIVFVRKEPAKREIQRKFGIFLKMAVIMIIS